MTSLSRWYEGYCHCRAVAFAFHSEPIGTAVRCNCSICRRRNSVMSTIYYPREAFQLRAGAEALSVYRFGDMVVNHYFCKHCGVYTFHDGNDEPGCYRINLGCVDQVDLERLAVELFDGKDSWTFLST